LPDAEQIDQIKTEPGEAIEMSIGNLIELAWAAALLTATPKPIASIDLIERRVMRQSWQYLAD
jgi:hypothetical protein